MCLNYFSRSSYSSKYFILPCCAHDFDKKVNLNDCLCSVMYMYIGVWDVRFGPGQPGCLGRSVGKGICSECRALWVQIPTWGNSFSFFHCLGCLSFFLYFFLSFFLSLSFHLKCHHVHFSCSNVLSVSWHHSGENTMPAILSSSSIGAEDEGTPSAWSALVTQPLIKHKHFKIISSGLKCLNSCLI